MYTTMQAETLILTCPHFSLFSCKSFRPGGHLLRLIHMRVHIQQSTDTNMTPYQWSYFHKNIICLVIILISKHVVFRMMQKYLRPVINCLLCCLNWYSWVVICSSHRICIRSHRVRMDGCKPYVGATVPMHLLIVSRPRGKIVC